MDLESIMLSEINQIEKDKHCVLSLYMESKKQNKINKQNNTRLIGTAHKQVVVGRGRVEIGEGN